MDMRLRLWVALREAWEAFGVRFMFFRTNFSIFSIELESFFSTMSAMAGSIGLDGVEVSGGEEDTFKLSSAKTVAGVATGSLSVEPEPDPTAWKVLAM